MTRMILLASGIAAIVLGALAATSCSYLGFDYVENLNATKTYGGLNLTSGSAGPFRFDIDGESCRTWNGDETDDFDFQMQTARYSAIVSFCCGVIGLALVWMEFACCRFKCSRVFECLCYFLAALGIGLSSVIYSSNVW